MATTRKTVKKPAARKKAVKKTPAAKKSSAVKKTSLKRKVPAKAPARALAARKAAPAARAPRKAETKVVGMVTHYFPKVRAAVVSVKSPFAVGDRIRIKGHTTDLTQPVASMQIDHTSLTRAKKGDIIGLLVQSRVRRHDLVTRL